MPRDLTSSKICVIAGEASGDFLGARLIGALKREAEQRDLQFIGVGGPLMEDEGLASLFPMRDLSVMGIVEVLPRIPKIMRRINQTVDFIERERPEIVITIDSPDFVFRVARRLEKRGLHRPVMVHYVAPTVWAWRPERAKKVAALYDGIICLYPFEPPYFEREGMKAVFAGHPVLEGPFDQADGQKLREELGISSDAIVLGALFGSRLGELNRTGPVLREAAERYVKDKRNVHIIAPTFPHLMPQVKNLLQGIGGKTHLITDQGRKWDSFAAMDLALATSGTVGLELAVADVPHVIAYKVNPLTAQFIRRKVNVKYAHLANILLDKPVVPEFIQQDCSALALGGALDTLDREGQKAEFANVRAALAGPDGREPSSVAARFVLDSVYSRSSIGT